jgi:hypothetical protein
MAGPSRRIAGVVWAATLASPLVLAVVALAARVQPEMPQLRPVFLFLATAVAGLGVLMSRALPPRIAGRQGASADARAFTRSVVAWAILEGAALFPTVAYWVTGDGWLFLVVGIVLAAHASLFPGEARWRALGAVRAGGDGALRDALPGGGGASTRGPECREDASGRGGTNRMVR